MGKFRGINYLFPPDTIEQLPTWRFVLHFELPVWFKARKIKKASEALKAITEWKAIRFTCDLDSLPINEEGTLDIAIEVPQERRQQPGSLADYESDVWRITGNMIECGFGDLYYEAIDFVPEDGQEEGSEEEPAILEFEPAGELPAHDIPEVEQGDGPDEQPAPERAKQKRGGRAQADASRLKPIMEALIFVSEQPISLDKIAGDESECAVKE